MEEEQKTEETQDVVEEKEEQHHPKTQELLSLVHKIAPDADDAFNKKNKSAARRARIGLMSLKKMVTPLRNEILEAIKK